MMAQNLYQWISVVSGRNLGGYVLRSNRLPYWLFGRRHILNVMVATIKLLRSDIIARAVKAACWA